VSLEDIHSDYECFYYNSLPFAEDIRQYSFMSLSPLRARKSFVPSESQKVAAEQLILALDLSSAAEDGKCNPVEALKPKYTYNPVLQRFYQCVQKKALNPQESVLEALDPLIARYINPDEQLFHKAKGAIKNFQDSFKLTKKRNRRR